MDHQRRLLLFGLSCFLILTGWLAVGPVLFPGMFPEPKPKDQLAQKADDERAANEKDGDSDSNGDSAEVSAAGDSDAGADPKVADSEDGSEKPAAEETKTDELEWFPTQVVTLGSRDPKSGYAMWVDLTSVGASVVKASLNDPRYIVETEPPKVSRVLGFPVVGNHVHCAPPLFNRWTQNGSR